MARRIDLSLLQDAVGNLLASDATLTGILGVRNGRIQGATRSDTSLPYVSIGDSDSLDVGVQGLAAKRVRFNCHVWTNERGFDQAKQIEGAIIAALDDNEFDVAEHRIVSCFYSETRFFRDPIDGVRHAVVEFDIDIEPQVWIGDTISTITVGLTASGILGEFTPGDLEATIFVGISSDGTVQDSTQGNLTGSIGVITLSSTGTIEDGLGGDLSGSIAQVLVSSTGTVENGILGDLAASVGQIGLTASGTIAEGVSGDATGSIGLITVDASGTVADGLIGDAIITLGQITSQSAATVADGISGALSASLGSIGLTSSGSVNPGITGTLGSSVAEVGVTSDGDVTDQRIGTLVETVEIGSVASGTIADGVTGSATLSLGEVTSTSSGIVLDGITGDLTEAIGVGLTSNATVADGITADLEESIQAIGVSSTGTVSDGISGTASGTVEVGITGAGTVSDGVTGTTVGSVDVGVTASGTVAHGILGDATIALGAVQVTSSGDVADGVTGTLGSSIAEVGVTSSGTVANGITGDATNSIGAIGITSDGTVAESLITETETLLTQMTNTQTEARKTAINDLMKVLVDNGIHTQLDWFNIVGADDDACLRNWIDPTQTLVQTNNAQIVHDAYFDTKSNPSGNGAFVAEAVNLTGATLGDLTFGNYFVKLDESGSTRASRLRDNQTYWRCDINVPLQRLTGFSFGTSYASRVVNDPYHMTMVHRGTGAADREAYYQGVSYQTLDGAGGSLSTTTTIDLIGTAAKDSDERILCAYFGRALSTAQVLALHNGIEAYKTAIGA